MSKTQVIYVLFAVKQGAEDWEEELITTAEPTPAGNEKLEKATEWAKSQGFGRFRIARDDLSAPDFSKTVRGVK